MPGRMRGGKVAGRISPGGGRQAGGGPQGGSPQGQGRPRSPEEERFTDVEQFVQSFPEQFEGMSSQAQERAMDTFNGAIHQGASRSDAIRMAVGTAKAFDGGRETGRTPSVQ